MTAKGTMMKTGWKVLVLCASAAATAAAGGCKSSPTVSIIKDPGPAQRARAMDLALEGQRAHKAGQFEKAMDFYQQSLNHSQDLFLVWNNIGMLLMEKRNYMNAAEMFKSAADLAPSDPRPYFNMGLIYEQTGYDEPALDYFTRSLQRDPRYLPSLRGAIAVGKHLDLTDDAAHSRVKTALLLETDPRWREVFERESLRIKGALGRQETMVPVQGTQEQFDARWHELRRQQPAAPALAPEMVPEAPPAEAPQQPSPAQPAEPIGGSDPSGGGAPATGGEPTGGEPGGPGAE